MAQPSNNEESSRHFGSKVNFKGISGRVGGRGGGPGKGFGKVLLVLGQTLAEDSTRLAPPSKDGVGGYRLKPHAADP